MAELAYERSGPERILSTFPLLEELIKVLKEKGDVSGLQKAMSLVAKMNTLRLMSIGVAQYLEEQKDVSIVASLVKDLGTMFEKEVAEVTRFILDCTPSLDANNDLERYLAQSLLHSPGFTLRGGTTEILRGIVAKGMVAR